MTQLFQRYATPFITGFFLISLISGVALFFHVGPSGFRGMHEWLSIVLILPFVLHLWKNWRPMMAYFKRSAMAIALVISAVAAAAFLIPLGDTGTADGPPPFRLSHLVLSHGIADVAPAVGLTAEALTSKLTAAGYKVADPAASLADIATATGKTEMDLTELLLTVGP